VCLTWIRIKIVKDLDASGEPLERFTLFRLVYPPDKKRKRKQKPKIPENAKNARGAIWKILGGDLSLSS